MRDPERYVDPEVFKPERFIPGAPGHKSAPERDPGFAFGFGRRICPGKELADMSLFLSIAMSLAAFNIEKDVDATGQSIEPVHEYTAGVVKCVASTSCLLAEYVAEGVLFLAIQRSSGVGSHPGPQRSHRLYRRSAPISDEASDSCFVVHADDFLRSQS